MHGVPAIAFSMRDGKSFDVTDHYLCSVLGELLEKPLGRGEIWNVNFPTCPLCDWPRHSVRAFPGKAVVLQKTIMNASARKTVCAICRLLQRFCTQTP